MIDKIKNQCTSCTACSNICPKQCITLQKNEDGFNYPKIDKFKCIECSLCENICPVINKKNTNSKTIAYAVKNKNEGVRLESTSGGFFSLLADYILENDGYVVGAAYDKNFVVKHTIINDRSQLYRIRGAKYSQSELGDIFFSVKKLLEEKKMVLFSGTPCQCEGLNAFLKKDYKNLITVDLICHGVPSPEVWQKYIDYRSDKENDGIRPKKINMRCKDSGWSNYGYSTEFVYENGKRTLVLNSSDLFMKAFVGSICLRTSCSDCNAKGINRCTDFTLGDYWGIWNQYPKFDDNRGISAVFVHSNKGAELLGVLNDQLELIEVDIENAYKENISFIESSKPHPNRDEFLKRVTADNFEELIEKYFPVKESKVDIITRVKRRLRRVISA